MHNPQRDMAIAPRDPEVVMKLARMGSFHQCRLSFMRVLLRRLKSENWRFERPVFDIDARGVGRAVSFDGSSDVTDYLFVLYLALADLEGAA